MENLGFWAGRLGNMKGWLRHPRGGPAGGWGGGGGAPHTLTRSQQREDPSPAKGVRKESPFSFLLPFLFNPQDLFDVLENYGQENNFLHFFFFFFPELSHLKTSQAPAVSKPAEFHVTRLFPCS